MILLRGPCYFLVILWFMILSCSFNHIAYNYSSQCTRSPTYSLFLYMLAVDIMFPVHVCFWKKGWYPVQKQPSVKKRRGQECTSYWFWSMIITKRYDIKTWPRKFFSIINTWALVFLPTGLISCYHIMCTCMGDSDFLHVWTIVGVMFMIFDSTANAIVTISYWTSYLKAILVQSKWRFKNKC